MPAFDIDGGLGLALLRGATVAALLSVFGTLAFCVAVAPRAFARMPDNMAARLRHHLLLTVQAGVAVGLLAMIAWLVVQAGVMADATSLLGTVAALPRVAGGTLFGHVLGLQAMALLAAGGVAGRRGGAVRQLWALALATIALALQAGHGHSASMYAGASLLLAADVLHLLGAGGWLGGLMPLLLVVAAAPPKAAVVAARWFSPLGQVCIVALVVSSVFQGWVLVGSVPGLVGTGYGWMALAKLALFAVLFGFAWVNRYRLAPALYGAQPEVARRVLVHSIAWQTGFGMAIIGVAAVLSSLDPAMHEQPVWPFAYRFTLDTVGEDPALWDEAARAASVLAGVAAVLAASLWLRRWRWAAACGAAVAAWFAVPHLDLLFVPAYPTSYARSPTGFTAASIMAGARLFPQHCATCHGPGGGGDGMVAAEQPVQPADLTAAHLWMHRDGELFWWLSHGMEGPDRLAMPGFANVLTMDERWALIDWVRVHNAGVAFHQAGAWPVPLQAPGFSAVCGDGQVVTLGDLRGGTVRIVAGPAAALTGVTTVVINPGPAEGAAAGVCIAADDAAAPAYAAVAGVGMDDLPGMQFLVDGAGWLRAAQPADATPSWDDPATLAAEIGQMEAHPARAAPPPMQMPM